MRLSAQRQKRTRENTKNKQQICDNTEINAKQKTFRTTTISEEPLELFIIRKQ